MPFLEIRDVTKAFGGLVANDHLSFDVEEGEIVGLIGPNGAGKTTLFHCVTGFLRPTAGSIRFRGEEIAGLEPDAVCRRGLVRTFQIVKPFRDMTVLENVIVAALSRRPGVAAARRRAAELLELGGLAEKAEVLAQHLTTAEKKRLELVRALACEPRLVMLDEAMAGLTPQERQNAVALVRHINRDLSITVVMVEHVMEVVMSVSQRLIVLDRGKKIAEGPPDAISRDERVIKAYLGERYRARSAGA